jgi:hypothetical protein
MTQSYIKDKLGYNSDTETHGFFYHRETIEQLLDFDFTNWTKSDLVVALGLAVVAMRAERKKEVTGYTAADWLGDHRNKKALGNFNGIF